MKLAGIDWTIIILYALFMLGAGLYFTKRASRSIADFFISGRSLPWWIAGTSMVATTFAADTPLFVTSLVRREGVAGNWIWFNFAISHCLTTFFLANLWRRAQVVTDVEFCELRYAGQGGRVLRCFKGAFFAFITNSVVLGWVLLAMATICEEVLGLPKLTTIGASLVLATLYASISGLWGVVATDIIQFIAAMVGSIVLMVKVMEHVGGVPGLAPLLPGLTAENGAAAMDILPGVFSSARSAGGEVVRATGGVLAGFLVAVGIQWWSWKYSDGGGVLIQRMSATKNERHSTLAMLWFTVANYVIRPWPWFMVALVSLIVFPELTDHKAAYPRMMAQFLGPGWLGLMMAAILAAFMSTVDTHINLASAYFVNDIYKRFLKPGRRETHYVLIARLSSVMFLILGSLIAYFNTSIVSLFTFLLQLVAGAGAVFLLRWFWWRINAWSEISAMTCSLITATMLNLSNSHHWIDHSFASWEIFLINVLFSGCVWISVTIFTRPVDPHELIRFYGRIRPGGLWGPVAAAFAAAPAETRAAVSDTLEPARFWNPRRRLQNFLLTVYLVYAALIGIGYLLYGRYSLGAILTGTAVLASARVIWNLRPGAKLADHKTF
jgi:solute:Na+ symporter, SSS family